MAPSVLGVAYLFPLGQDQLLSVIFLLKVTRISFSAGSTSMAPTLGSTLMTTGGRSSGIDNSGAEALSSGWEVCSSEEGSIVLSAARVGSTGADVEAARDS